MYQLFSKISKYQKMFFCAFLFLITLGILIPTISIAQGFDMTGGGMGGGFPMGAGSILDPSKAINSTAPNPVADYVATGAGDAMLEDTTGWMETLIKGFFMAVIGSITFWLTIVLNTLASLAAALLLWVMGISESVSYTQITGPNANIAVATGWPIVRDLANMVVVLGFVIIGIAFSLRMESYGSKKVLINLIIAALLINFSLMICGIFIDGSNMVMNSWGSQGGGYLQHTFTENMKNQTSTLFGTGSKFDTNQATAYIGTAVGMVFQNLLMFITFMLFFFLFLFRYLALWILVILSPLAFVFYVFPFTKKFFDMWWNNFFQWCIIGIPGMFFIFLSNQMADKMNKAIVVSETTATTAAGTSTIGGTFATLISFLVPGMFLIAGFLFSLQSSAMGSGAISSAFKKYGMKTAKSAGSRLNELSSRSNLGQAVRDKASVAGAWLNEKTYGAKGGNVERTKAKRRSEAADSIKDLSDDQINARLNKSGGRGSMGAALVEAASSRKILGKGRTAQEANTLISNAEESGSLKMRSDATNSFVALAEYDKPKVKKIMDQHPGWTEPRAKHEAVVRAATKLPEESLDRDFVDSVDHTVIRDVGARLTNKKKEALRKNTRQSLAQEARTKPVGSFERKTLMNKLHEINNL